MSATRARVLLQPGYVLHRRPYRDSSLLLEMLTPQFGRVGLVARGARQPKSRLHGALQPFRPLLVSWSGGGELATLTAAEGDGAVPWLSGSALMGGFYINELLVRLLHRFDPHPGLYTIYHATVQALAALDPAAPALEPPLRLFEKHLLEEVGYGLVLEHDAEQGRPIEAECLYVYHLLHGPVPVHGEPPRGDPLVVRGRSLLDLARGWFQDETSLREAKRLTRAALAEQLGSRPLASRSLLKTVRSEGSGVRGLKSGSESRLEHEEG